MAFVIPRFYPQFSRCSLRTPGTITSLFGTDTGKKKAKRLHFKNLAAKASESNKNLLRQLDGRHLLFGEYLQLNKSLSPKLADKQAIEDELGIILNK